MNSAEALQTDWVLWHHMGCKEFDKDGLWMTLVLDLTQAVPSLSPAVAPLALALGFSTQGGHES